MLCPYGEKTLLNADCSSDRECAMNEELRSVLYGARLDNPQATD